MPRVWEVPVHDSTRVRDARVAAERAAALAGLDEPRTAAAALVATELATNLLKHAGGGRMLVDLVAPPTPSDGACLVQIAAIDHGPGPGGRSPQPGLLLVSCGPRCGPTPSTAAAPAGCGRLLTQLHTFLHHLQPDLYATAVIARFRPGDPTLTWAAAGHPPPVLRTPDGQVHTLDAKPGAMLGIPLRQEIHDHTAPLAPGSTLALYTDGLVERRAQGIDPGIERLARALGSFDSAELDADLEGSADRILAPLLSDSERDDDVCLLLCHLAA
ncbi:hypothetical protein GCM10022232_40230 [Streptomyces plumbiresistens]|uniref:PPM-type phosphatase domain-containing protein n=1 Tax=Streptomyces plumbiresistens TaxID=511811 RepID=A0ABP7RKE7_9ACTN